MAASHSWKLLKSPICSPVQLIPYCFSNWSNAYLNNDWLQWTNQWCKHITHINCPKQLTGYLMKRSQRHCQSFRDPTLLPVDLPHVKTKCGQTLFKFSAVSAWNKLPREIRELTTLAQFKGKTFAYLINMDNANHTCTI